MRRDLTLEDLNLMQQAATYQARRSYWAFRQFMNPRLTRGWFQRDVARHLQKFSEDLRAGRKPKMILQAPPQHGKSDLAVDFDAYLAGVAPDLKQIYASFSDRLGVRANLRIQRAIDNPRFKLVFPGTVLSEQGFIRNREMIEFAGHAGSFRNTTIAGRINGEGFDFGLVDDPLKGRKEANSEAQRNSVWDWFTDDFFARFSESYGFLMILTRWHVDDPAGRLMEQLGPEVKVLRYPALAEVDEEHRRAGEPLFPEHKSLHFLMERKELMTEASWEAEYQQNPVIKGGGLFPVEQFVMRDRPPPAKEVMRSSRYWDKAGTRDGGAFTAGVLMHLLRDGRLVVEHVYRKQVSALDREAAIRHHAEVDNAGGRRVETWVEQEPGSGGKESAESTVRNLIGFIVHADRVTGDKYTRAEPYAAQVQGGNVELCAGDWNRAFLGEHELFPYGKYKDQVDAAAGACAKVCLGSTYTLENVA